MSPVTRYAAVAALTAVVVAGAMVFGAGATAPAPTDGQPAPTADPGATADPAALAAFREARDAVCIPAAQTRDAYIARFDDLTASDADRIAAFEEFVVFLGSMADELERLEAPAELHDEHIANVTQYRDTALVIMIGIARWKAGHTDPAVDYAKGITGMILKYQRTYGFADCA